METVNIEKIMDEIRQEIREKGYEEPKQFEEIPMLAQSKHLSMQNKFDPQSCSDAVMDMSARYAVAYYRPLTGSGIKLFFKRVLRRLIGFILCPALEEITAYHAAATTAVSNLQAFTAEQLAENARKDKKIAELEQQLAQLKDQVEKRN